MLFVGEQIPLIGIFIFIVVIIISISLIFTGRKNDKTKDQLVNENKFVLEKQKDIAAKLDQNADELKSLRNRLLILLILLFAAVVAVILIDEKIIPIIILILIVIVFGYQMFKYNKQNDKNYNEIVTATLHEYDSNLEYYPNNGFTESEYKICLFPEMCDRFTSEDMIVNSKKSFCYSDICVESEHEDSDDNTYYVTEFQGSLARIDIKDINCEIYLGGMKGNLLFRNNNYTNIKFENDEFNKIFRACSNNEFQAYKILTPDVMEEFVKIKKTTFGDIDIRLIRDKLYIRFLSGDTFDSTIFNKEAEKKALLESIAILEVVMKTMDKVKEIIENKNIS